MTTDRMSLRDSGDVAKLRAQRMTFLAGVALHRRATYSSANRNAVLTSAHQHYRDAALLEDPHRWYLVAQARSEWLGEPSHYLPLQPYHRALSEAHAALTVLRTIADNHR